MINIFKNIIEIWLANKLELIAHDLKGSVKNREQARKEWLLLEQMKVKYQLYPEDIRTMIEVGLIKK